MKMKCIKRIVKYLYFKIKWHKKLSFTFNCTITNDSEFEGMSQIHSYTSFRGRLGYGSYIGSHCDLSADIGRFTSIAPYVRCNAGVHPYKEPFVATSPCFYSLNPHHSQNGSTFANEQIYDELDYYDKTRNIAVKIGADCWIGEGVFLVGGIKIGNGAVVLAHAVVTKDIPDYAIVGGVPGKIIGYRYDQQTIDWLLKIKWWNNTENWFKHNWKLLCNLNNLKEYYNDSLVKNCRL